MAEPNPDNPCFGCGGGNPRGMRLVFGRDDRRRRFVGRFRLGPEYQGAPGLIHGGILATVLDEAMGKLNRFREVTAVTAELRIEYLRPVRVDEEITVESFQAETPPGADGRVATYLGEIRNGAGTLLVKGRGKFVAVDPARYRK